MTGPLILAVDQGTSATKCALVDRSGAIVARGRAVLGEQHPKPGWVEQDPAEIWDSVRRAVADCLDGQDPSRVAALGFSTQRESLAIWDRRTGEPLAPLISWQDQRTTAICDALRSDETEQLVRERSGLPLDPMFSAAKARWLLDAYDPGRVRSGEVCLGTVDSWLLSRLGSEHVTEAGNASRTQLLDVRRAAWDEALLDLFGVPEAALPRVVASTGPYPASCGLAPLPDGVPVLAVMGDSHAALFAHGAAFEPGRVKATYGTGSSVMGLAGDASRLSPGVCLTIAWQMADEPAFAAEGNIRSAGASLVWMAALLGMSVDALVDLGAQSESRGVVLVPGFGGLGAPWWDRRAVGLLSDLTLGTGRAELARAGLESIVHQVADVVEAIGASVPVQELRADGGPSGNNALMQMQADLLGVPVSRARDAELSALGVAHMAGLGAGIWSRSELQSLPRPCDRFEPALDDAARQAARRHWRGAVERAMRRAAEEDPR